MLQILEHFARPPDDGKQRLFGDVDRQIFENVASMAEFIRASLAKGVGGGNPGPP